MNDIEKGAAPEGGQQGHRQFFVDGTLWRVYERPYHTYDRRSGLRLMFESEATFRSVRDYPADWEHLPEDELIAISWRT